MANINLQIPRILQRYCDGQDQVTLNASNVAFALRKIQSDFPELYVNICDETGRVRQHINLFINNDLVDKNLLEKSLLNTGDDLLVFTAVSGG